MAHKNSSNWSPQRPKKSRSAKHQGRHKKPQKILSFDEADDRLYDIFRNHDFGHVSHEVRHKLVRFYQLLMEQQTKENFTRLLTLKDVAIKHFIDCLVIPQLTELTFPLIDVGTGPGFPGIPLRIITEEKHKILLAEGVQKRVVFLKEAREQLELKNLDILGRNINDEFMYPVQGVITRAVEDCRNTLGNVINSLQTGGKVFLMKGPNVDPEIEMALDSWGEYYKLEQVKSYNLPQTPHQRRLVVFKKIKNLPENQGE